MDEQISECVASFGGGMYVRTNQISLDIRSKEFINS